MNFDLDTIHQAAIDIARKGGDHTLAYFNGELEVERKSDDSPVTIADRETEEVMRTSIAEQFPEHGIIGEEYGQKDPESDIGWMLDPIDETKSVIDGVQMYIDLSGVMYDGEQMA